MKKYELNSFLLLLILSYIDVTTCFNTLKDGESKSSHLYKYSRKYFKFVKQYKVEFIKLFLSAFFSLFLSSSDITSFNLCGILDLKFK